MNYVCKVCGYVYDEEKAGILFSQLPQDWVCPICKAGKNQFQEVKQEAVQTVEEIQAKYELKELSNKEISAVFSNLAKGCEKQYKNEEAEMYQQLADYFGSLTQSVNESKLSELIHKIEGNLNIDYPDVNQIAQKHHDRGTQRVRVWGEKVTNMLLSILSEYEKQGDAYLHDTSIWVCTTCGFVYLGETAPSLCPVCKVPDWKFEKIGGNV